MVAVSKVYDKPDWDAVEKVAERFCNVCYKCIQRGAALALEPKQDIVLTERSQELFANYFINGYWTPYVVSKVVEFGAGHQCVQAVLWCACSALTPTGPMRTGR